MQEAGEFKARSGTEIMLESWKLDLEDLKERIDVIFPEESWAKSTVKAKLEEARMWASEMHGDIHGI